LFKTRQWQDSLLKWAGLATDYLSFLKSFWIPKLGGETGWDKALQDGVVNSAPPAVAALPVFNSTAVAGANATVSSAKKSGNTELVLYQKVGIGTGEGASNPWLLELPDPVTKATWDNYVIISPAMAKTLLDIDISQSRQADNYEVHPDKKLVKVTVGGKSLTLPSLIIPGTHPNTIGIAVGYGRTEKLGKAGAGVGQNVFQFFSI